MLFWDVAVCVQICGWEPELAVGKFVQAVEERMWRLEKVSEIPPVPRRGGESAAVHAGWIFPRRREMLEGRGLARRAHFPVVAVLFEDLSDYLSKQSR